MSKNKRPTERQRVAKGIAAMEADGSIVELGDLYCAIYPTTLALLFISDKLEALTQKHGFYHFRLKQYAKAVEHAGKQYSDELFRMFFRNKGIDINLADLADKVEEAIMNCVKSNVSIEHQPNPNQQTK